MGLNSSGCATGISGRGGLIYNLIAKAYKQAGQHEWGEGWTQFWNEESMMETKREKPLLHCGKQKETLMSSPYAIYTVVVSTIMMMVTMACMMIVVSLTRRGQHHQVCIMIVATVRRLYQHHEVRKMIVISKMLRMPHQHHQVRTIIEWNRFELECL